MKENNDSDLTNNHKFPGWALTAYRITPAFKVTTFQLSSPEDMIFLGEAFSVLGKWRIQ